MWFQGSHQAAIEYWPGKISLQIGFLVLGLANPTTVLEYVIIVCAPR